MLKDRADVVDDRILAQVIVTAVVKGDDPNTDKIRTPAFIVFHVRREGEKGTLKVAKALIFIDTSPVFGRIQAKAEKGEL